nr:MAG TPA: hypothetical protein [Caudoviricetes sp.]
MLAQRNRPPYPSTLGPLRLPPSLLPLVFLPALSGFFIFRVAGITLDALLVNQPDGPEPFTDYR